MTVTVAIPLRQFTALAGDRRESIQLRLMLSVAALNHSVAVHREAARLGIGLLCDGIFPLIAKIEVIDPATVHLTFANDTDLIEFRLTDGDELEMVEV